tara:strand:+ start:293 stop:793 length:501 start_codon:yes stop_codon:yes gene_type:complete
MILPNRRLLNLAAALACAGMMAFALYSQHVLLLDPCPLCILQRIAVIAIGLVFLVAAVHNPGQVGSRIYAVFAVAFAVAGAAVAGWHVRLQNLPADEVPSCGPGLEYMVENFPLKDILGMVLKGSGECADVAWSFLGLTMPTWVLINVILLGLFALWNNAFRRLEQ